MTGKVTGIKLSTGRQAQLQRQLESGQCENLIKMLDDVLRLMNECDAAFNEWLREEMRASLADKHPPSPTVRLSSGSRRRCTARLRRGA